MSGLNIGMIGTRFAGLDGVTLESVKVAQLLEGLGHAVSWFAGRLDVEFAPGVLCPPAYFDTPENASINDAVFGVSDCPDHVLAAIEETSSVIEDAIERWAGHVDVLLPQNALAIPMQIPLGVAITRFARRSGRAVLAHHHDLAWERQRFWPNAVAQYLTEAFPPTGDRMVHLVINSIAQKELEARTGATALVLPNVMDFKQPPPRGDGDAFRRLAGVPENSRIILQPTRMVPRKGIEDTIELAARFDDLNPVVIVTHPEPDEGIGYVEFLQARATELAVDFRIVPPTPPATLADAYAAADLVTFPSRIEGFGNALLETLYYGRPLLVNRYPVYVADIAPTGIEAIEMGGTITDEIVARARHWLEEPAAWAESARSNYDICRAHFSHETATAVLAAALDQVA